MKRYSIALLFIYCSFVSAQSKLELRLSDCITKAIEQNPSIRISQSKVRAAEAKSSEVGTALLPQVKFSGRLAELSSVPEYSITLPPPIGTRTLFPTITENYSFRFSLQQPIFTGFKLSMSQEVAELQLNVTREDFQKDQTDLIFNTITTYWNLYRAYKVEEVLGQSVGQMEEHLKNVKNLAQQGMATDADVMKVNVQLSDIKVRYIESKNSIRIASMVLNSYLSQPLETEIIPIDTPKANQDSIYSLDLQLLKKTAKERRPEIKAMQLRNEITNANVTAARGGWYPQVYISANYDYANPNQRILPPEAKWNGTWDVGLMLQWNVWDWFATEYQITQAEAVSRQAEAGLVQINDAVLLEVAQQYYGVQTAGEKVQVAYSGMMQAQESYRMTSEKFKNGLASNADLLDAEISLLQAKLTHTQSVVDYALSTARLKKAVGDSL